MKRWISLLMAGLMLFSLAACSSESPEQESSESAQEPTSSVGVDAAEDIEVPEGFLLIIGGTFTMGSPDSEAWRSADETQHSVTVSDFYMSAYEVTQQEYQEVIGDNPSNFSGENLPVENISWLDAVAYCNARSEREGLTPAYTIDGTSVSWDRSANGYRLPTEAEWEYACRAGTTTPFNTETSISAEESNYWGDYPYMIEDNYFNQGNLDVYKRQIQAPVYGTEIADRYTWLPCDFAQAVPCFLTELCFGDFNTRIGIDSKTRELLTVVLLAALGGAEVQVKSHVEGALKVGNTKEEVVCALVHASGYMGIPRLFNALNACKDLLANE